MKLNENVVAFTGGGTGGHIYPGLAVADELKSLAEKQNHTLRIIWIGCSAKKAMDKKIVEKAVSASGKTTADAFYGIPSGKLRRYFDLKNFSDMFRIIGGFFAAYSILRKEKPAVLFSKGGFVSVPPCIAARLLKIPVYTHECDFTLGLANRINFKSAKTMFVSYEETKNRLSEDAQKRVVVTGNPVRPTFYNADKQKGYDFLGITNPQKPVLLVLGGSSGAKQINTLVSQNLEWLCENYIVVHQTGLVNNDAALEEKQKQQFGENYKPYAFIYEQMPDVLAASDVILSRAGANSIWEAAVLYKPMVLVPLCGSGTRGDQVDNAKFFEEYSAAKVLLGDSADDENLKVALGDFLTEDNRKNCIENIKKLVGEKRPAEEIAKIIFSEIH
ncbi:MAG: UDP-N-acetylglucosamine--N-acetylmuramyl-(pentapeptide) pyrophosphoryl-undecaprenol N-acetylglucosamine transferase [Treponema sp.]|nr:UDP-N-acetylglucosamine--N-acetylmuramyl-(pentapeptide) pyrophosphoryl-undecaprenol N-acetylglucosamine transferase [Treponema sp.]